MYRKVVLFFLLPAITLITFLLSCQKPVDPQPVPPPGGGGSNGGPTLPPTPYDYAGASASMPVYLKNFISANPAIDNMPVTNPITNDGATLGRVLFYDKSLSLNNTIACASCHHQDKGFVDGEKFSKGFENGLTRRNSMPLANLRFFGAKAMFWDYRAATLEDQVLMPIQDHLEMGMPSLTALTDKLKTKSYYPALFTKAFGSPEITSGNIAKALAQFIRSIVSFDSKFDKGLDNDFANFTAQEKAGMQRFKQLNCSECHSDLSTHSSGQKITMLPFQNIGINTGFGANNALDITYTDNGIGEKTGLAKDMGTFKMPSLRNVELTAPYMHDGRFATLEEVLTHYQSGLKNNPNIGIQLPVGGYGSVLSDQDKANIILFLKTLTGNAILSDVKYSDPFR
ncbi:MAG: cytochrome c peroxidase [Chitinophagaceae bacterium]